MNCNTTHYRANSSSVPGDPTGDAIPIYFSFEHDHDLALTARSFLQTLLQQYVAYRRVDPSLVDAALTLHDIVELAPAGDDEFVSNLLAAYDRERASAQPRELLQFCLSAPQRLSRSGRRILSLIDTSRLAIGREDQDLAHEVAAAFNRARLKFALSGLRRHVLDVIHRAGDSRNADELVHLEKLTGDAARKLAIGMARRYQVETNEPTRDLIVQQFDGNAFFINGFLQAASEKKTALTNYLDCQRLYVDELMGGRIHRCFANLLEDAAPNPQTRRNLLRVLFEAASGEGSRSSVWSLKKRIGADAAEFDRIIDALHVHELVNSTGAFVEVNADSYVWMDYLRTHYRADVTGEPRALIVASTLTEALKRAPQAMALHYRRQAALGIQELISQFDCQSVPASLFRYDQFARTHKGAELEEIDSALESEPELIRLPQVVHVTSCASFDATSRWEEERSAVAHGFEAAEYTDENEVVWLAAEIDSKLEVSRDLAEEWRDRLAHLARECNFAHVRLWLVSREGFSEAATKWLRQQNVFTSSQQQIELLTGRITADLEALEEYSPDEYEMVIPMGADTELIAAHTVEQIARRVNFQPEAINQIKTALVEACINAAEHSLSPDRKIYQRFRVEDDKLVVTVASRGVVPANLMSRNGQSLTSENDAGTRRGWGLKLIRSLMDEVEFRRVDDGTQLRMTKYIRR